MTGQLPRECQPTEKRSMDTLMQEERNRNKMKTQNSTPSEQLQNPKGNA